MKIQCPKCNHNKNVIICLETDLNNIKLQTKKNKKKLDFCGFLYYIYNH
jgi:hypothetical protein